MTAASRIKIGPYSLTGRAILAPMAGLTDQVFRNICRNFGAAMAVSEMSTADTRLWDSRKSATRLDLSGDNGLRVLQIAGSEPAQLADAARAAVDLGAQIVDINMGCPAKKVCRKASGSALLQDEKLVARILEAVVAACAVPVTLKMRTGWSPRQRNGETIARIAERTGIAALAVHGRTRACMFNGQAEFETIRAIKAAVNIPVFANGDIETVKKAREVLDHTAADAVMIGRGALGRPWFFATLNSAIDGEESMSFTTARNTKQREQKITSAAFSPGLQRDTILSHLNALHAFYGEERGVRVGRKHLSWYCKYLSGAEKFRQDIVRVESAEEQLQLTTEFFATTSNRIHDQAEDFSMPDVEEPSSAYINQEKESGKVQKIGPQVRC